MFDVVATYFVHVALLLVMTQVLNWNPDCAMIAEGNEKDIYIYMTTHCNRPDSTNFCCLVKSQNINYFDNITELKSNCALILQGIENQKRFVLVIVMYNFQNIIYQDKLD